MEHWHANSTASYQTQGGLAAHSSRILSTSSGNVQTYALDSKEGIENQDPFAPGIFSIKQESSQGLHYPIPKIKLGSNDQYSDNLHRLQQRRQHGREKVFRHRRTNPERPYLQHPKYTQYRARQRCDTGPDGKPVWDDRIEDAFQNALCHIEPMGRRKKSQRGRPHGRNELISEWIKQETGEYRTRKQVSSHIQVLNTLLKGIPEWDALITASEGGGSERTGHGYYSDSIAQVVRSQNTTGSDIHHYRNSGRTTSSRPYSGGFADKHYLTRLNFEMWVSLPNQMDQALHSYSRLQSSNATSMPIPLDDIKNWKLAYPNLRPIVDNWSVGESCDIILLDASFKLMSEFPPRFSKLGISLELDFLHSSNNNGGSLGALRDWSCRTHMWRNGRLEKEVSHDDCHVAALGKIKPFFESKWWASTFTLHTEKRKLAEDSKSDAAIQSANEYSRNFFRGLTVMQEISAQPPKVQSSQAIWNDHPPPPKRMAILLWKFSQAPDNFVGTTTWQKVVPPSDRSSLNSSAASKGMTESALTIDSIMGSSNGDDIFGTNVAFVPGTDQEQYNLFGQNTGNSLYQDDFMDCQAGSMASFEDPNFDLHESQMNLDHDMQMALDIQSHELSQLQAQATHTTTNFFELPQLKAGASDLKDSVHNVPQHDSFDDHDDQVYHQPLATFDMSTHKILQAQLGTDDHSTPTQAEQQVEESNASSNEAAATTQMPAHTYLDEDDEALRAALLAASVMSELGGGHHDYHPPTSTETQQDPTYIPSSQSFTSPSTLTVRPPLQTHHSFTRTSNIGADQGFPGHSRQSSKTDFASILANLQAYNSNHDISMSFDFGTGTEDLHDDNALVLGLGISRPQSQPVLQATATDALYEEIMGHLPDTSTQRQGENHHESNAHGGRRLGAFEEDLPTGEGFVVVQRDVASSKESLGELLAESGYIDLGNG